MRAGEGSASPAAYILGAAGVKSRGGLNAVMTCAAAKWEDGDGRTLPSFKLGANLPSQRSHTAARGSAHAEGTAPQSKLIALRHVITHRLGNRISASALSSHLSPHVCLSVCARRLSPASHRTASISRKAKQSSKATCITAAHRYASRQRQRGKERRLEAQLTHRVTRLGSVLAHSHDHRARKRALAPPRAVNPRRVAGSQHRLTRFSG